MSFEVGKLYQCSIPIALRDLDKKDPYRTMHAHTPFVFLGDLTWESEWGGHTFMNNALKILTVEGDVACVILPDWANILGVSL